MPASRRAWLAGCLSLAALAGPVRAQSAGLRVLVASPPGGLPDQMARQLGPGWVGRGTLTVENRPGASGLIAVGALQLAPSDGGTLLLGHAGLVTMNPFLFARLPYDPGADLLPVAPVAEAAFGLAVGPAVPAGVRQVDDLLAWARANEGHATIGSPGTGTLPHVLAELLARAGKVVLRHVPYAGGPPAVNDLVGGRLTALVLPEGLLRPLHLSGRLRLLATSRATRHPQLPHVPSFVEAGFAGLDRQEWWGLFAPRGMDPAVRASWSMAVRGADATAGDTVAALDTLGLRTLDGSSAEMARRVEVERAQWRELLPGLGIRMG